MPGYLIQHPVTHFAASAPDDPALACSGASMSYRELDLASNRLAQVLLADGLRPGDRVGVFQHKALEMGVTIYGILKAGGVFVPLDPFSPVERLAFALEDCGIQRVVGGDSTAATLGALDPATRLRTYGVSVDTPFPGCSWDAIALASEEEPAVARIDRDLAYLMYTSGSTGRPKAMMHSHRGSIAYARWGRDHVGLQPGDRVASHAPLHFDLSIFDLFSTVQAGATVVFVPEPITKFPASWTQYVEDERISVVFTVPYTLIEMLERGALDKRDLSSLRWILFGGEPFPPKHLRTLMERLPEVRFTNVYGPAEAPSCTCYDVPRDVPVDEPLPIGTVSRNSEDLILDEDGKACGVDEPGELLIRSSTLTHGYWGRPERNASCFHLVPGSGPFPHVYYRTGDQVVRRSDGLLRFLGRQDRMIKTRGHRVELDEVEAGLASHPAVEEAAAFAVPDDKGSRAIEAAVTLRDGSAVEVEELLRHARTRLPGYALPRQLEIRADFPRTSGGKIDRRRLAEERG